MEQLGLMVVEVDYLMEVAGEYLTGVEVILEEVLAEGMEEAMAEETGEDVAGAVAVVDRCNEF